ncbi:MAG: hypothetical protein ACSNEK_09930 [Parachlamydiaceae bacterium]
MNRFRSDYKALRESDRDLYEHLLIEEFIKSLVPAYEIFKLLTVNQLSAIKSLIEETFPHFHDNTEISKGKQKFIIRDIKQKEDGYEHLHYSIQIFSTAEYKVTLTKKSGIYPKPEGYAHDINRKIAILTINWILSSLPYNRQNHELHLEALSFAPSAQHADILRVIKALRNWSLPEGVSKCSEQALKITLKNSQS